MKALKCCILVAALILQDGRNDFEQLRAAINALLDQYAERFEKPQPNPPAPVEPQLPHTADAYRQLLVSPEQFGELKLTNWNAPPRVGDVTLTEDTARANLTCDALSSSSLADVLRAIEQMPRGNRDIRDWWDNDVHGRAEFPWITMLRVKAAALGDQASRQWLEEMRAGDPLKYSPYRIANTLIAWGPDGGLQQTGKHYNSGWGHGYEGMFANTPFLLLYVWQQFTGEDLISRVPFYTQAGRTITARIKPYYECGLIGPRASFTLANMAPTLPGIEPGREGLSTWPLLPPPPPDKPIPAKQWTWLRGDGVVTWPGDVQIDVTAPAVSGQRAQFVPRCYGFMIGDQGLPFVHSFKGGCGPRNCSGLQLGPIAWSNYYGIGTTYKRDGGFDRPNSAEEALEHLNPAPTIAGNTMTLTWPALHGRRGTNSTEQPNNVSSTFTRTAGSLVVKDVVTYQTPKAVTLTFTLSEVPHDRGTIDGRRVFQTSWGQVAVTAASIAEVKLNTEQLYNRDANHLTLDEVYNPYKLEVIAAQLFVEYLPATSHELETHISTR